MKTLIGLLALILTAVPAAAQLTDEQYERFRLFMNCEPMRLVAIVEDVERELSLTEESVGRAVRSRLRSARLYDEQKYQHLSVYVHVAGRAFSIDVGLRKPVYDYATELIVPAPTWSTGITGTHGGNADYVLSAVGPLIDEFLDEYLRVNESACTARPPNSNRKD